MQSSDHSPPLRPETCAIHAGTSPDASSGAVAPPIVLSTTFERAADGGYPTGFFYSRAGNPNRTALEGCLAALENASDAAAFSSGSAVTAAVLQALSPGDHAVFPDEAYHGTGKLVRELAVPWGLKVSFCNMADLGALRRALRPNTRLVWIETPSNPMLRITDIAATAALARKTGAVLICDNTWPTPIFTRPLELGADLVMHSSSKYLGGHGDVLGGIVAVGQSPAGKNLFERIRTLQTTAGAVPSPFDCWLLHRGLRTLAVRVRAQTRSAALIARHLSAHSSVKKVFYPGLADHPGHEVAARQMQDFGAMLSFQVQGGREEALGVAARVRLFTRATSLGSVESLIEHRASIENYALNTPDDLLRVSVGLEHVDDLIADLDQALSVLSA